MGLYTPTILGGNSYLSWFYGRGAIKDPAHTGSSKGLSQAINRGPIRKFLPKYANVYVTIQSHGLSAGAQTHYVTAKWVRNGLSWSYLTLRMRRTQTARGAPGARSRQTCLQQPTRPDPSLKPSLNKGRRLKVKSITGVPTRGLAPSITTVLLVSDRKGLGGGGRREGEGRDLIS